MVTRIKHQLTHPAMACTLYTDCRQVLVSVLLTVPLRCRVSEWDPMQHAVERLEAAIAKRRGSAEEITALFVALLRSHGLAVRFVRCRVELLL